MTREFSDIRNAFEERRNFFRNVQVWPTREEFDCEGWIDNFSGDEEKFLATKMLSDFLYFPKKMLDRLFYDSVGIIVVNSEICTWLAWLDEIADKMKNKGLSVPENDAKEVRKLYA